MISNFFAEGGDQKCRIKGYEKKNLLSLSRCTKIVAFKQK